MFTDVPTDIFSWATIDPKNPYVDIMPHRTPNERMMFILDDGTALIVNGESRTIGLPLKKIREELNRKYKSWNSVTEVIHNHLRGSDFSTEDYNVDKVLRKLGFTGKFRAYHPRTGIVRDLKQEIK